MERRRFEREVPGHGGEILDVGYEMGRGYLYRVWETKDSRTPIVDREDLTYRELLNGTSNYINWGRRTGLLRTLRWADELLELENNPTDKINRMLNSTVFS